jgi:hypothetical protein
MLLDLLKHANAESKSVQACLIAKKCLKPLGMAPTLHIVPYRVKPVKQVKKWYQSTPLLNLGPDLIPIVAVCPTGLTATNNT